MHSPAEAEICDTTPVRYFALAGQFDLLSRILGGIVKVPRQVLNPDEDPNGIAALLSEIGHSERYWLKRSRYPKSMEVSMALVDSAEAELIYQDMCGAGYRGPQDLLP